MREILLIAIFCLASWTFLAGGAWGVDICVDPGGGAGVDYADLQAALTYAQGNNDADTIKVVQGTYNGNFSYDSSRGCSITLRGGYTAGCSDRVVDPTNTVLDSSPPFPYPKLLSNKSKPYLPRPCIVLIDFSFISDYMIKQFG